jgi:hypothetical protein
VYSLGISPFAANADEVTESVLSVIVVSLVGVEAGSRPQVSNEAIARVADTRSTAAV